jgi:hypothetical protein
MFFGTDKIGFDVTSSRFPGEMRHFDRFSEPLKEIIDARIWAGLHYRTADVQAQALGRKVVHYMASTTSSRSTDVESRGGRMMRPPRGPSPQPGCREPPGLLPTRRWSPKTCLTLWPAGSRRRQAQASFFSPAVPPACHKQPVTSGIWGQ